LGISIKRNTEILTAYRSEQTELAETEEKSSFLRVNLSARRKINIDIERDKNGAGRLALNKTQKSEIIFSSADSRKLKLLNEKLLDSEDRLNMIFKEIGLDSIGKINNEYIKYKGFKEKQDSLLYNYKDAGRLTNRYRQYLGRNRRKRQN